MSNTSGGESVGNIYLNLNVNQNRLGDQVRGASQSAASSISSSVGGIMKKMVAAVAASAAIKALKDIGSAAIDVASDLAEVQNVVNTSFGSMADKCEKFASSAMELYGISELMAKKTSSTYMAMASQMGLSSATAAQMSINVAKLSADVASFYNLSNEEAAQKLNGIFTGEGESLKSLGVLMSATNLEAYAMAQGLNKSYSEMTQGEQTALRYKYVMEQLSLAQGDFNKTSDGWSNQTKILSQRWQQFLSIMGNGLIKVLQPVLKVLNDLVAVMTEYAQKMSYMFGWSDEENAAEDATAAIGKSIDDNVNSVLDTTKEKLEGLQGFDEINSNVSSNSASTATAGLGEDWIFGNEYLEENEKKSENVVKKFINTVKGYVSGFWEKIGGPKIVAKIKEAFSDFFNYLTKNKGKFQEMIQPWIKTAEHLKEVVVQVFGDIKAVMSEWWENYGKDIIDGVVEAIKNLFSTLYNLYVTIFLPVWNKIISALSSWWENSGKNLFRSIMTFIGSISKLVLTLWNDVLLPFINWFIDNFGQPIVDTVSTIIDAFQLVADFVSNVCSFIFNLFSTLFNDLIDMIHNFKDTATDIKNFFTGGDDYEYTDSPISDQFSYMQEKTGFSVPFLADGGIVAQPTLSMIGEAGPEAVVPLDKFINVINDAVEKISETIKYSNSDKNMDLTVNLGTKTILSELVKGINRMSRNNNGEIIISTR